MSNIQQVILYYHYLIHLSVFHTNVSWRVLSGVRETAILLKSPGLFSVFWSISIILQFGSFSLLLLFPNPSVPVSILSWQYRLCQLQLASSSYSCFIVFFTILSQGLGIYFFLLSFSFLQWSATTSTSTIRRVLFFFCWLFLSRVTCSWLDDPFVSQNPSAFRAFHFQGWILVCAYTISLYCRIWTFCIIPSG